MPMTFRTILNIPIAEIRDSNISIESRATPCRIRLINCVKLVQDDTLFIDEFEEFPLPLVQDEFGPSNVRYSAISYVWKGNERDGEERLGYFTVQGAESGDPISISVLHSACLAAWNYSEIPYIWLDRLCIMQKHREDKNWQIARMFLVYKNSEVTIILPGGIQRLVRLDEETAWVHRAWTLQEALATHARLVLHRWEEGEGWLGNPQLGTTGAIMEIQASSPERTGCALTELDNLVEACKVGSLTWTPGTVEDQEREGREIVVENVNIIAKSGSGALQAFLDVLRSLPGTEYSIWRSAHSRTSSRPVDMVFSIMGLFGVNLDPAVFERDDRLGATIALAREILRKGGTASWIGFATRATPCRQLSTFPEFPETSVEGKAWIRVNESHDKIEAGEVLDEDSPVSRDSSSDEKMIQGEMDEKGYLNFRRRACVITPVDTAPTLENCTECLRTMENPAVQHLSKISVDGKAWYFHEGVDLDLCEFPRTFAVGLGSFVEGETWQVDMKEFQKLMLLQEHAPGKSHVTSYFKILLDSDWTWVNKQENWKEFRLSVGGPDVSSRGCLQFFHVCFPRWKVRYKVVRKYLLSL